MVTPADGASSLCEQASHFFLEPVPLLSMDFPLFLPPSSHITHTQQLSTMCLPLEGLLVMCVSPRN